MKIQSKLLHARILCGLALVALGSNLPFACLAAAATFTDANWSSMNPSIPGADGSVDAAVIDGAGNLYVAGNFTVIGDMIAKNIAKWDGSKWSPLGSGLDGFSSQLGIGSPRAMAVLGNDLYVAGQFTTVSGIAATNIAKWNGSSWSALGPGVGDESHYVNALAVSGSNVYAGGTFTNAGHTTANCIAKWDGNSWSAVGLPMASSVSALAVIGSDLYVGGYKTTAAGSIAPSIAKWDGSNWSALGSGIEGPSPDSYGYVLALAVSGSDLYVGGRFTTAGSIGATNIAKWNGSTWSALGYSALSDDVRALAASDSNVYTEGYFVGADDIAGYHIAKWNGSSWLTLGRGIGARTMAISGSDLYVEGFFTTVGGIAANNIAKWNGSSWSALGSSSGPIGAVWALAASGNDVYAGGEFTAGGVGATNIAKWNGTHCSALGSGMDFTVSALAVSGTDVYAGGHFTTAGDVAAANVAKWNGTSWSALGLGVSGFNSIDGPGVLALAVSGSDLYAGGLFTMAGDVEATNIAKWNGSSWSALGLGLREVGCCDGYGVFALAVSGNDLYAGGYFHVTTVEGTTLANVAKWDGTNWSALGLFGRIHRRIVKALAVSGNELYASDVDGIVHRWDGSNWSELGGFSSGAALAIWGIDLYASGNDGISKWNGSSWTALGSGVNGGVRALAVSGSDLYAGGSFTTAGGKVSAYIARAYLLDLPPLSVRRSDTDVKISWPSADTMGFALEQASTLIAPGSWVANTAHVADDGTTKSVNLPATSNAQFFRLRRP